MPGLADQLAPFLQPRRVKSAGEASFRWAKVTAVGAGVVSIQVGGSTTTLTDIRHNADYAPTINDIVLVMVIEGDHFVICQRS